MASGTINFNADGALIGKIDWNSVAQGSVANSSVVTATIYARRNDGYATEGRSWGGYIYCGGNRVNISLSSSIVIGSNWVALATSTATVGHTDDGRGYAQIYGEVSGPSGTSLAGKVTSGGEWVTLDTIARYLTITKFDIINTSLDSTQVSWATDVARSSTEYSLNGGSWVGSSTHGETVASDSKSGTFNITGLTPNTKYTLKIRCHRKDNGLITESGTKDFKTKPIATITKAPNFNVGTNPTVQWSAPVAGTVTLYAEDIQNTPHTTLVSSVTVTGKTSYTLPIPAETLYNLNPKVTQGTIRYVLQTTKDGKTYTSSATATYYITNANPVFSNFEYADQNSKTIALTGSNQILVKNYSTLRAWISTSNKGTAQKGAQANYYSLKIDNQSFNSPYKASETVYLPQNTTANNLQSGSISVYMTDTRGLKTGVTKQATFKNYSDVVIKEVTAERSNNGVDKAVTITYNGEFWNNSFGTTTNTIKTVKYQYKESSASTWTNGGTALTATATGNTYSGSAQINGDLGADGFDQSKSFNIRLTVSDELSTKTYDLTIGQGLPAIAIYQNNVAIGQKYDTSKGGALQVNGSGILSGAITTGGTATIGGDVIASGDNIKANGGAGFVRTYRGWTSNFNTAITHGFYSFSGVASNITGCPLSGSNSAYGTLDVIVQKSGTWVASDLSLYIWQRYMDTSGRQFFRYAVNSETFEPWRQILLPTTLYDNASASSGNITLSETAANFAYIEIFYRDNNGRGYQSVRVASPNGKTVGLNNIEATTTGETYIRRTVYYINGTTIGISSGKIGFVKLTTGTNEVYTGANFIYIYKVVGWK